ncbi:MAG: DUF58 domain-containing protein [Acidimicrobiales bacterium]|nr:DUF58 domain-containing protein [Acidimicrobiales bacterium]
MAWTPHTELTEQELHVPELMGRVERLHLRTHRLVNTALSGGYRSSFRGSGVEFEDVRPYMPGDDVRRIDWNVTARMQEPYVRETIADRELETWVVVDRSPSLDFGTAACEKRDLAVAATAAIGFLTARTGNRFGVLASGGAGIDTLPARGGRAHLLGVLHRLVTAPTGHDLGGAGGVPPAAADLGRALRRVSGLARRRGLVVVVSDFLGDPGWQHPLRLLAARHEALAVEIIDPRELELPDVGVLDLIDAETGERREVRTSAGLRARYADAARAQRAEIAAAIRGAGTDHLILRTDRDWLLDLVRFVTLRRQRVETLPRPLP